METIGQEHTIEYTVTYRITLPTPEGVKTKKELIKHVMEEEFENLPIATEFKDCPANLEFVDNSLEIQTIQTEYGEYVY